MKYIIIIISICAILYAAYSLTKSEKISIGSQAPQFTALALFPNKTTKQIALSDFVGKNIVLYFYPKDNTPICTLQAETFRNEYKKLQDHNINVLGVSYDSIKKHTQFQCDKQLPYPLISDTNKKISTLYHASGWFMPKRKTILIDTHGNIVKIFEKVKVETQIEDILQAFLK